MMRYQGLSPEAPLSNGRRSHWRTCKEDDGSISTREISDDDAAKNPNFVEGLKGVPRFRSPSSKSQDHNFSPVYGSPSSLPPQPAKNGHHHNQESINKRHSPNDNGVGSGDVLLQWGHRKRSRISRSIESRTTATAALEDNAAATAAVGMAVTTDDSSSSSSSQIQTMNKIQRRSISLPTPATAATAVATDAKIATNTTIMPPPSSILLTSNSITAAASVATTSFTSNGKGGNLKSCNKDASSLVNSRRYLEDQFGGGSGSHPLRNGGGSGSRAAAMVAAGAIASSSRSKVGKRSPSKVVEKNDHHRKSGTSITTPCSSSSALLRGDEKLDGLIRQEQGGGFGVNHHNKICSAPAQEAGCSYTPAATNHHASNTTKSAAVATATEKATIGGGGEVNEWPRVYIPLTRKEKEEDFLVMKGTKLPHRPKKRPKAVDRMIQYVYPGMWLSDVTKARYEVKEKKCTTKKPKRRGLKGMESMESDSE